MGSNQTRIIEVDVLRGVAIIMMVAFHATWDLNYLGFIQVDLYSGPQALFAYSIGTLFLILVGISLTLSHSRAVKTMSPSGLRLKYLTRGLRLLALGALITIVTWLIIAEGFIVFGILSCIGLSIIFAFPLINRPRLALSIGAMAVILGVVLHQFSFTTYWLLWLGFIPQDFFSVDYFPMLPWFGVVLIGITIGNHIYGHDLRSRIKKETIITRPLGLLGRHSLLIYLIHQPLILGLLLLLSTT